MEYTVSDTIECVQAKGPIMKSLLKLFSVVLLVSTGSAVVAKETVMYKKVDKNGKIIFTDKPIPGSTPITVKTDTNVVSTPKPQATRRLPTISPEKNNNQEPFKYEVLAIDEPSHDQAVRANSGDINVIVGMTPNIQPNHSLQLVMDGSPVGQPPPSPYFSLNNVDRGTHQLAVTVIDEDTKKQIQTSETITFHLLRASILNR